MTLGELLRDQARLRPETVAIIDDRAGGSLTFAELEQEVNRAVAWWEREGLKPGQAVLVFVPMSASLYVALLALFRLGAVALFLDPSAGREHLERCCERWPPDALFAIPKAHLLRLRSAALRRIPLKINVGGWVPGSRTWQLKGLSAESKSSAANPSDPALVTFTSGSTGEPKAAVRTQAFLLAQYRALQPNLHLVPGDVDLATLPIFVLANLAAGVTTVLPSVDLRKPGEVDPAIVAGQIQRRGVTRVTASPAFFERLVAWSEASGQTLDGLRQLHTGGAPVFPRLLAALQRMAPRAEVVAVYGSTEAEPIAHVVAHEISAGDGDAMRAGKGLLAGVPVKEVRFAVVPDQWSTPRASMSESAFLNSRLGANEVGELVVSGDHVLKGYLGGIGDEETKFRVDGVVWHRTGDAGCLDERGRLWLSGRCSARIEDKQGKLYPFGVECVAMTFPGVRRAAALSHRGQRVLVVEASRNDQLEGELKAAIAWAHIVEVIFVAKMPVDRRHNAKIDYPALKALLGE